MVTKISGPKKAYLTQTISVNCTVRNKGDEASGAYEVELYLSKYRSFKPSTARFMKKVAFASGLAPGESKKVTIKVTLPNNWLDGLAGPIMAYRLYHFGIVVGASKEGSLNTVHIQRYKDNGDKTVSDFKTGLMWQKARGDTTWSWSKAITYCTDLELGGHDDWVLPPIEVLTTIVDYTRGAPACDPAFNCHYYGYWSSSTSRYGPPVDVPWVVDFSRGEVSTDSKSGDYNYVRCVRSGP